MTVRKLILSFVSCNQYKFLLLIAMRFWLSTQIWMTCPFLDQIWCNRPAYIQPSAMKFIATRLLSSFVSKTLGSSPFRQSSKRFGNVDGEVGLTPQVVLAGSSQSTSHLSYSDFISVDLFSCRRKGLQWFQVFDVNFVALKMWLFEANLCFKFNLIQWLLSRQVVNRFD